MDQAEIESSHLYLASSGFGGVIDVDLEDGSDGLGPELGKIDKTPEENRTSKFPKCWFYVLCF